MKTVGEILTTGVQTLSTQNSAAEAAAIMRNSNVGALPVIDAEKEAITGILTDRDIVLRVVAEGRDPNSVTSGEIMTDGILTCNDDQTLEEAGQIMEEKQVRRLLVLNPENGQAVGIVSLGDIALNAKPSLAGEVIHEVSKAS